MNADMSAQCQPGSRLAGRAGRRGARAGAGGLGATPLARSRARPTHLAHGPCAAILRAMPGPRTMRVLLRRLLVLAAFVGLLWAVQVINWATGYRLNGAFGLIPREVTGLDGIAGMPILHGGFAHLAANTPPLLVMGGLLALTATRALVAVNAVVVGAGGLLVWLLGSPAVHVGASGLVFGWFGFLVARGVVDRSPVTLGAALLVGTLYGAMVWGVLPGRPGVSWEAHLFGALAGAAAAVVVRTRVHAPRLREVERR